jgi:hypothetical protein
MARKRHSRKPKPIITIFDEGLVIFSFDGVVHRENGPAYIDIVNNEIRYYKMGRLTREDGPAILKYRNHYYYNEKSFNDEQRKKYMSLVKKHALDFLDRPIESELIELNENDIYNFYKREYVINGYYRNTGPSIVVDAADNILHFNRYTKEYLDTAREIFDKRILTIYFIKERLEIFHKKLSFPCRPSWLSSYGSVFSEYISSFIHRFSALNPYHVSSFFFKKNVTIDILRNDSLEIQDVIEYSHEHSSGKLVTKDIIYSYNPTYYTHNLNGPAKLEYGSKKYFIDGKEVTEKDILDYKDKFIRDELWAIQDGQKSSEFDTMFQWLPLEVINTISLFV